MSNVSNVSKIALCQTCWKITKFFYKYIMLDFILYEEY